MKRTISFLIIFVFCLTFAFAEGFEEIEIEVEEPIEESVEEVEDTLNEEMGIFVNDIPAQEEEVEVIQPTNERQQYDYFPKLSDLSSYSLIALNDAFVGMHIRGSIWVGGALTSDDWCGTDDGSIGHSPSGTNSYVYFNESNMYFQGRTDAQSKEAYRDLTYSAVEFAREYWANLNYPSNTEQWIYVEPDENGYVNLAKWDYQAQGDDETGATIEKIYWTDATRVDMGGLAGHLIAPFADINITWCNHCGAIVGHNITTHGEAHINYWTPEFSSETPTPTITPIPTIEPTSTPTIEPTTVEPTETPAPTEEPAVPTTTPTIEPTISPMPEITVSTEEPTHEPTAIPTVVPTIEPTITPLPTETPTSIPTRSPTSTPSPTKLTATPTVRPTKTIFIPTEEMPEEVIVLTTPSPSPTPTLKPTPTPVPTLTPERRAQIIEYIKNNPPKGYPPFASLTEEELEELIELFGYQTPLYGSLLQTGDETPIEIIYAGLIGLLCLILYAILGKRNI